MKLIYTSEDRFMIWNVKNTLEMAGYDCHIRNEYAAGGAGDIAPIETWPEVWLDDDGQFKEARDYIEKYLLKQDTTGQDWFCSHCGEANAAAFDFCWNCHHDAKKV